ncbi:YiiX/YebB-like N1pC/P60 family cysteine hydrolase [Oleiagrimonas sp. C23AA]|uniref:YiiX/YebB-like N1pC/P60 family cysteine hydrolase n=1 Tax=Oleiagrimonas sp. C23AA TaxID=2719047 RepID=UPI00142306F6|nr:YiiX/YebB-like N1pC/P60 family cysteine hydrolase [Oleiagrimonas sp. C23AA]NII09693.1 lipo-like protein [Oleiagrimonas sp. C23AA]
MAPLEWVGRALARFLGKPRQSEWHFGTSSFELLAKTLRKGDVVLVEGSSRFSTAIKYLTQSSWSHAALFIGEVPEAGGPAGFLLLEADVEHGVRVVPLDTYAGQHTRICRAVGLCQEEIDRLVAHAMARIGQRYDVRNIVDLMRFLLPTPPLPGRWRRRMLALGSGDPTRAICSSLIAEAFQSVRYPILPRVERSARGSRAARHARREILHIRNSRLFTPRDFDISPYFRIIKPLIEQRFDPHRLRWARPEDGTTIHSDHRRG